MLIAAAEEAGVLALGSLLEAEGYRTEVATSASETVAKAQNGRFAGLVVDVGVGEAAVLAVLERVRRVAPGTPVLGVVAAGSGETALQTLRAGADEVVVKPIDAAKLRASLARAHHWRAQREKLGALSAELRRVTAERDALQRLAEDRLAALAELDRLKEEFLATASHDLRAPLTSIRGYAQLLLRSLRSPSPDLARLAQGLGVIDTQTAAMADLLSRLLDASRIQAGKFEPRTAPCELGECLAAVLASLGPEERARVDVTLEEVPLAGQWERGRIEQVLANLARNALKYSPAAARVDLRVERRGAEIVVSVGDHGMGIPPEELPRLFARFHRTPQALASGLPGTGLGLYICRGIVEAHGGRIWAESPGVGRGATFRFTLPAAPRAADAGEMITRADEGRRDGGP